MTSPRFVERPPVTLAGTVGAMIEARLESMQTSRLCRVVSYDAAKRRVTVKPVADTTQIGRDPTPAPILADLPVAFPRMGAWEIVGPIEEGAVGLVIFDGRSLDEWVALGKTDAAPADPRRNSLLDGIFVPLAPTPDNAPPATDMAPDEDLVIGAAGGLQIRLTPDGTIGIGRDGDETDLLALLCDLLAKLQAATVNTSIGPQPLQDTGIAWATAPEIVALSEKLNSLKRGA